MTDWSWSAEAESIRFDPVTMQHTGIVKTRVAPEPVLDADTPEAHCAGLLERVTLDLSSKYLRGQREHGGMIHRKPGLLRHAIEEALDELVYLYSLEGQQLEALDLIRVGLTHRDWSKIDRAYRILIFGNPDGEVYRKGDE